MLSVGAERSRCDRSTSEESPLHPGWLPDRELFAESTDWIVARLPVVLRAAPFVAASAVLVMLACAWFVTVPVDAARYRARTTSQLPEDAVSALAHVDRERLALVLWQRMRSR